MVPELPPKEMPRPMTINQLPALSRQHPALSPPRRTSAGPTCPRNRMVRQSDQQGHPARVPRVQHPAHGGDRCASDGSCFPRLSIAVGISGSNSRVIEGCINHDTVRADPSTSSGLKASRSLLAPSTNLSTGLRQVCPELVEGLRANGNENKSTPLCGTEQKPYRRHTIMPCGRSTTPPPLQRVHARHTHSPA